MGRCRTTDRRQRGRGRRTPSSASSNPLLAALYGAPCGWVCATARAAPSFGGRAARERRPRTAGAVPPRGATERLPTVRATIPARFTNSLHSPPAPPPYHLLPHFVFVCRHVRAAAPPTSHTGPLARQRGRRGRGVSSNCGIAGPTTASPPRRQPRRRLLAMGDGGGAGMPPRRRHGHRASRIQERRRRVSGPSPIAPRGESPPQSESLFIHSNLIFRIERVINLYGMVSRARASTTGRFKFSRPPRGVDAVGAVAAVAARSTPALVQRHCVAAAALHERRRATSTRRCATKPSRTAPAARDGRAHPLRHCPPAREAVP